MSKQSAVFSLITQLGAGRHSIVINRGLVTFMGSLEGGVFLSQLLYWCDKGKRSDGWFYKTYAEWTEETTLSEYQVRTQAKKAVAAGWLETTVKKANGNPTVHYRVDTIQLSELLLKEFQDGSLNNLGNGSLRNFSNQPEETSVSLTESTDIEYTESTTSSRASAHTPQQEMFNAICEAIGWDYNTLSQGDRGQVAQAVGILVKANYTVDDIRCFMTDFWFKDWRWEKSGKPPTIKQLRQEIGIIRSTLSSAAPPPKPKTGLDGYFDMLEGMGINPWQTK